MKYPSIPDEIFQEYLIELDRKYQQQKRKILLFVDNCPSHPPEVQEKLKCIKLVFLPACSTSVLQPMDQGVKLFDYDYLTIDCFS